MWLATPFILALTLAGHTSGQIDVVNQWNLLDFNLPYDYEFINRFRPENVFFTGMEISDDRVFLAMPRIYSGVPATLASIPRNTPPGSSPVLQAYPSWDYHRIGRGQNNTCDGLISVYRMRVDACNRLWVVDAGVNTSLEEFRRICPPKIVIINLKNDQVERTIIFPDQVLRPSSLLTNIVIEENSQRFCDNAFVYISDTAAPGLVVYDSSQDTAWRVTHPSMFPDPNYSDYDVAGDRFTLMDGVVGLALSQKLGVLYYQPLATDRIFSVPTQFLRKGPPGQFEVTPVTLVGKKSSQGIALALNEVDDTLYFSPLTETSIASYNPLNNQQSLVAFDPQKLQFTAELRWHARDGSLWMLSSRFQKFFLKTVNPNEVNLRIIHIHIAPNRNSGLSNSLYYK